MFITDSVQRVYWIETDSRRVTRAHRATKEGGVRGALWATRETRQGPGTTVPSVGIERKTNYIQSYAFMSSVCLFV